jgi:hypothetical protein
MSASVARSEKILNKIANQANLSEPAVEWLKTTLDPFHDTPLNCTGIPDCSLGNSVVQCIKSSCTILAPPAITTGTWDAHVIMMPFSTNTAQPMSFSTNYPKGNTNALHWNSDGSPYRAVTPMTILAYPTGAPSINSYSDPFAAGNASSTSYTTTNLSLTGNFTSGDYRVISQGFEVINTTSELNVQGLCTVYRSPVPVLGAQTTVDVTSISGGLSKGTGSTSVLPIQRIPNDTGPALLLPNTKQWKAKEGCYVVGHLNDPCSIIENNSYLQPMICYDVVAGGDTTVYMPAPSLYQMGTDLLNKLGFAELQWSPFDISGAFFTGLSPGTSLTINWNVYIERFPSVLETDLVVLAKPSPEYCPMAFELYKAIAQHLPVGVPQKENGLGDWFRDAVSTVSDFITPVLSMIPHPVAQAGAVIGRTVGGMARRQESASPALAPEKSRVAVEKKIAKEEVKEIKKELTKHTNSKRSKHAVMPSAKKAHKK